MDYQKFRGRSTDMIGKGRTAAVMVLIEKTGPGYKVDIERDHVILEKRALTMRSQPGDICFPGGRVESGEKPQDAAVRETVEELGIALEDIEVICDLDYLVTPTRNIIYPFLGIYRNSIYSPSAVEVDSIVRVPLKELLEQEAEIYTTEIIQIPQDNFPFHRIVGGKSYSFAGGENPQLFYSISETTVWGATALILKSFLNMLLDM